MQAYQIWDFVGADGLRLAEMPEPQPDAGQVVVRVRAVSLNFRDLAVAHGRYARAPRPGVVPASDGAGEVVAVGAGVTQWQVGDRVAGTFFQTWQDGPVTQEKMAEDLGGGIDGMLREQVALPAHGLVRLPAHLSLEEGATLPCAAVTAWNALVVQGGLHAGETVLTLGSGGVSVFALQFAKMHGARVIATSGSDAKRERLSAMGADETINYRDTPDWETEVWRLTEKRGVDQVVEVGGAGTLEKSLRCARVGSTVSLIGVLTGQADINPYPVLQKSIVLRGIYVGSRDMFESMNRALAQTQMHPVIDRVFPFAEAPDAFRYLESGAHFGKVVISIP